MKLNHIIRTFWDSEAKVWVAEGVNFGGLATEAETVDELIQKIPLMIMELNEAANDFSDNSMFQLMVEGNIPTLPSHA